MLESDEKKEMVSEPLRPFSLLVWEQQSAAADVTHFVGATGFEPVTLCL